jgi:hypothetical protein
MTSLRRLRIGQHAQGERVYRPLEAPVDLFERRQFTGACALDQAGRNFELGECFAQSRDPARIPAIGSAALLAGSCARPFGHDREDQDGSPLARG